MKQFFKMISLASLFCLIACTNVQDNSKTQFSSNQDAVKVSNTTPVKNTIGGYSIGDIATDFSLLNVDGKMVSLSDFSDAKGFIITFTCNHCPYSIAYEDRLIALDKKYKSEGYPVIAINPNNPTHYPTDSYENMKVRAKNKGFTFPYLFDDGQRIHPQYGATKTPHIFILQKTSSGNRVEYIGAIDNNIQDGVSASKKFVEMAINALLNGKEPPIRKTKAIGCSIKT